MSSSDKEVETSLRSRQSERNTFFFKNRFGIYILSLITGISFIIAAVNRSTSLNNEPIIIHGLSAIDELYETFLKIKTPTDVISMALLMEKDNIRYDHFPHGFESFSFTCESREKHETYRVSHKKNEPLEIRSTKKTENTLQAIRTAGSLETCAVAQQSEARTTRFDQEKITTLNHFFHTHFKKSELLSLQVIITEWREYSSAPTGMNISQIVTLANATEEVTVHAFAHIPANVPISSLNDLPNYTESLQVNKVALTHEVFNFNLAERLTQSAIFDTIMSAYNSDSSLLETDITGK